MNNKVITVTLNPAIDKTGEVNNFKVGNLNRISGIRIDPGGKGINVAKVLFEFGVDVIASGLIAGFQGEYLLKALSKKGIRTDFLEVPGETRTNLKIFDVDSSIITEVNEPGFIVDADNLLLYKEKLSGQFKDASVLVLAGSVPIGSNDKIYKEYIELANSKGVKTILDADDNKLAEGITAKPYAIKPNIHELEKLVGHTFSSEQEIVNAMTEIVESGISIVIVSLGADGAFVMNKDEAYRVKTYPIISKSTVGAGDSMVGALAYCLVNNLTLEEIAAWTTTAGTITASKSGTQVCTLAEVLESMNQVKVIKIR